MLQPLFASLPLAAYPASSINFNINIVKNTDHLHLIPCCVISLLTAPLTSTWLRTSLQRRRTQSGKMSKRKGMSQKATYSEIPFLVYPSCIFFGTISHQVTERVSILLLSFCSLLPACSKYAVAARTLWPLVVPYVYGTDVTVLVALFVR